MVLQNVIKQFLDKDYDVDLFTSKSEGFLSGLKGVNYFNNYYLRSNLRFVTFFNFFLSQLWLFFILLVKLKRDKNTILYVNTVLPFSGILIGKILKIPTIVHVHENKVSPDLLNTFLFFITNAFADYIIIVSNFLKKNHVNAKGSVHVLYNSVTDDFEKYPKKIKQKPNIPFTVLMMSSLRPYKGIKEFVELAAKLSNFKFNLVLSEPEVEIEKYFAKKKLPNNLNIFPAQKNVHVFYENSDLVVNLSDKNAWVETFGMTILEAMHYGLPVIVPTVGGITELVYDGLNGFKIDSKKLTSISSMIQKLEANSDIWFQMGRKSLEVSKSFSKEKFNENLDNLINDAFRTD